MGPDCLGHLGVHFLHVLNLPKPALPVRSESGHGTLPHSTKYLSELEGKIAEKESKRSFRLSPTDRLNR